MLIINMVRISMRVHRSGLTLMGSVLKLLVVGCSRDGGWLLLGRASEVGNMESERVGLVLTLLVLVLSWSVVLGVVSFLI